MGAELFHADGWTDRRTYGQTYITELIVTFCYFADALKNQSVYTSLVKCRSFYCGTHKPFKLPLTGRTYNL